MNMSLFDDEDNMSKGFIQNTVKIAGILSGSTFGNTKSFMSQSNIFDLVNNLSFKALPEELALLYKDVQRVTTCSRMDSFEDYCAEHLLETKDICGYIPPITISLNNYISLKKNKNGLDILYYSPQSAFAVDGLGRINTWMRMLSINTGLTIGKTKENNNRIKRRKLVNDLLSNMEVSIIFILPSDDYNIETRDLGQIFSDINFKQEKVKPIHALRLNCSDPIIQYSREIAKLPQIKNSGGMSDTVTRITKNTKSIISLNTIVRFVQGCIGGHTMQSKTTGARQLKDGTEVNNEYLNQYKNLINTFIATWIDELGERFYKNKNDYQVSSSLIQSLGLVFYSLYAIHNKNSGTNLIYEITKKAKELAMLDYSKKASHWSNCDVMKKSHTGYINSSSGGATFRVGLAKYFCEYLGISLIK